MTSKLKPNHAYNSETNTKFLKYYKSLTSKDVPTGKISVGNLGYAYEYEKYPGIYFYKSGDGMQITAIELKITELVDYSK
jgi:hypothetical protein